MDIARPSAIVIGTGFGGAVTSCRLAQAGFEVTVLERGRRYDKSPSAYPRKTFDDWLWGVTRGFVDVIPISEMQVVQAAGYGGGSLIYANVHLRVPPEVFESGWPKGYSRDALDPYYDLVAYMLDIQPITASPLGMPQKSLRMAAAAEGLGRQASFFHPPLAIRFAKDPEPQPNKFGVMQGGCTHCGECVIGCQNYSKNTLDRNYLAVAERLGARMLTDCEVTLIEPRGGGQSGYRIHYMDHGAGGASRTAEAPFVFVCGGAVNSTTLLLRSRVAGALPNISPRLGERYSANGDVLAFAFDTREKWEGNQGPTITTALVYDGKQADSKGWFVVEEGGFTLELWPLIEMIRPAHPWLSAPPPGAPQAPRPPGEPGASPDGPPLPSDIAAAFRKKAEASPPGIKPLRDPRFFDSGMANTALFLAQGRDRADGRIELLAEGLGVRVRWDVGENLSLYSLEERLIRDLTDQLGGTYASTPFWRFGHLPISVHNLGGCTMGDSPEQGVTNGLGEVFGHPDLFVMDGALLPGSTGVNPAHTIAAVAERNVEQFIRRITRNPDWAPPERPQVQPFEDPLTGSRHTFGPGGSPAPVTLPLGLVFHESLDGNWQAATPMSGTGSATCELDILLQDISVFISDPAHVAIARGKLTLEGFTASSGDTVHGIWSVLVSPDGGHRREVRYTLPFQGLDGRLYTLHGVKQFEPRAGLLGWNEHATLRFVVREGDSRDGRIVARGELDIGLRGLLNLPASFREIGAGGLIEQAKGMTDFLQFYFGTIAELAGA